jgi:hypothetical protein
LTCGCATFTSPGVGVTLHRGEPRGFLYTAGYRPVRSDLTSFAEPIPTCRRTGAAANPQKLDWKTSIADLLKPFDLKSSFAARKELATELGCPGDLMGNSAKMNIWLHKAVLKRIADDGGNIPSELRV